MSDDALRVAAERLLNEVARLRRDLARLHARIEPYEGEVVFPEPKASLFPMHKPEYVLDALNAAANEVSKYEFHLNKIRSVMDSIESDAISREEMREYLVPRTSKKK